MLVSSVDWLLHTLIPTNVAGHFETFPLFNHKITLVEGLVWAISHGFLIRRKAKQEQECEHTFELHALLLAVSVIVIPVLSLSPLHLLWMVPASFVLGLASVLFPLNLLWMPASLYGSLWYIGYRILPWHSIAKGTMPRQLTPSGRPFSRNLIHPRITSTLRLPTTKWATIQTR